MDNVIMIQAGEFIDSHLGVTLGLSTLTAAALGNVCSDTSGCLFGGIVESLAAKLQLSQPNFTPAQAQMRVVKLWGTGGAVIGVICGCMIGMTQLLVLDLERSDRLKKAKELETIFQAVLAHGKSVIGAQRCTLYLYDKEKDELWTKVSLGTSSPLIITLPLEHRALATSACKSGELVNIRDAYLDERHDSQWDKKYLFKSKQVLCMPVFNDAGKLLGCVQAVNVMGPDGKPVEEGSFTEDQEKLMRMLAAHIAIFLDTNG